MWLAAAAVVAATVGSVPLPDDWASGVAASNLLFAATPAPPNLLPSIENGFIGGDVGCSGGAGGSAGALHLAGLYSGGSHTDSRAGLPNPLAAEVVGASPMQSAGDGSGGGGAPPPQSLEYGGAALDVSQGVFLERWPVPSCGASAVLSSARYAHRAHRSLLAWRLELLNATLSCRIMLQSCAKPPAGMDTLSPGVYQVSDPEQPADPAMPRRAAAIVAIASNTPTPPDTTEGQPAQWTVSLGPDHPSQLYLAVVRTTLESSVTRSTALAAAQAELATHAAAGSAALAASHAAAWADAFGLSSGALGGGIEVAGNLQFAAQINSSLYYLLCSVRSDWAQGVSEGGIGSEAYRGMMFCEAPKQDMPSATV